VGIGVSDSHSTIAHVSIAAGESAIYLQGAGSTVELTDSAIAVDGGNPKMGTIDVREGATATIRNNTIVNAESAGLQLGPIADVEVTGNTITGPGEQTVNRDGPYGIRILRGVSGTVTANQVAGYLNTDLEHSACGIVIDAQALKVVVSENRFPEPGNEIDLCDARPRLPPPAPATTTAPAAATPMASPVAAAQTSDSEECAETVGIAHGDVMVLAARTLLKAAPSSAAPFTRDLLPGTEVVVAADAPEGPGCAWWRVTVAAAGETGYVREWDLVRDESG
jgi:hypothetical protein